MIIILPDLTFKWAKIHIKLKILKKINRDINWFYISVKKHNKDLQSFDLLFCFFVIWGSRPNFSIYSQFAINFFIPIFIFYIHFVICICLLLLLLFDGFMFIKLKAFIFREFFLVNFGYFWQFSGTNFVEYFR